MLHSPVQEHDVPFPGHQEECVTQFRKFGQKEEEDPKSGHIICPRDAHGWQEAFFADKMSDFDDSS